MKAVWGLLMSSASLLLTSHFSGSADVTHSPATSRVGLLREAGDNMTVSTVVSVSADGITGSMSVSISAMTDNVTASTSAVTDNVTASTSAMTDNVTASTSAVTDNGTASTSAVTDNVTASTSAMTDNVTVSTSAMTDNITASTSAMTDNVTASTSAMTDNDTVSTSAMTDNVTASTSAMTDNVTVTKRPPPVYTSGVLTASEFLHIWEIQGWFFLSLEPIALVLLVLSAIAFLQDRHFASNCYLAALCLFEAWYMLMLFVHYVCRQHPQCWVSRTYVHLSIWSVSFTAQSARRCVYTLNGFVSFQRYVAVAFPLKIRSLRWLQRPMLPLMTLALLSFLLHLYRPLQYIPVLIKEGERERWTQGFSSRFKENKDTFVALADVAKYLTIYIPMLVCLLSNCLMILSLSRHKKKLSKMNHGGTQKEQEATKSKAERQTTVTILTSTFLMVLLNTPININEAVSLYSEVYGMYKRDHYLYLVMRRCFSIISQACDIMVALTFLILSTAFRRRFFALFRPVRHFVGRRSAASDTSGTAAAAALHSITQTTPFTKTSGTN
ncbi:hypothetical protein ACOMHN_019799 [Nucella lapillus]